MTRRNLTTWRSRLAAMALLTALLLGGVGPAAIGADAARDGRRQAKKLQALKLESFSNNTSIAIPNNAQTAPSTITVSGFETEVADVDVSLIALTHPGASSLDVLLVGPRGQTALIMSDAGGEALNDSLTLSDQAPTQLPNAPAPLVSGVFQPTNYDFSNSPDTFSPPAPTNPGSGSALAVFNGTDPNGTWTLFIKHQNNIIPGQIGSLAGGWELRITSANGVPKTNSDQFRARAGKALTVPAAGVLANDRDPDGDPLTASLAGKPTKGKVSLQADGSFTYRSRKKAKGTDSFTYLAQDTTGLSALDTVTIQIKGKKPKKGKK